MGVSWCLVNMDRNRWGGIQLEHPTQWVTSHTLPVVTPKDPTRQPVEKVDCKHPAVHIHNRLYTVMRQRAQIYLGIRLPQHIRQQRNRQRSTKPHEPHKTRRNPELAHPQRRARRRLSIINRQRRIGIERGEQGGGTPPVPPREGVGFDVPCPPGGSEEALGVGEGVAEGEVAFVRGEDGEGDGDGHGHCDEGPEDPDGIVVQVGAGGGDVVEGDGGGDGEGGDGGDG